MYSILILASWFVFGLIHSLTASVWLKQLVALRLGWLTKYYRLLYNAIALLTFLPVLWLHWKAPAEYVSCWQGSTLIGLLITALGVGMALTALWGYDLAEFIGWPASSQQTTGQDLRQTGLLRYVRHPLYTGILLSLLGIWLTQPTWSHILLVLAAAIYIRIGIYFEEQKLVSTFGESYKAYRQRVPMLLPRFFSR
ncbi:methyltransferase family protein [Spirosoma aerolatum]|uniref:methyltransferase family protein n=1 Tax=Spirosoma aerolatum TaxID=1211326 RepID=UPI001FECD0C2|nr:isoprenylcysteine carboxylmethyltransferase family protein [Spirosoma aerolatum]